MEELQEKSLQRDSVKIEIERPVTRFEDLDADAITAIRSAAEKKAENMTALDLRPIASFTDLFVIASGANQRQVQAIADGISETIKKTSKRKPIRIEGYSSAEWVLMDYGDFVFHIFEKKAREFYDLERLWRDAVRVELPAEL